MIADSSVSRLHAYFRDLFLEELRADDGWSEYIDLLVRHLDLAGFDYLQEGGVPYYFRVSDFLGISGPDAASLSQGGEQSPCLVFSDSAAYYLVLNAPRAGVDMQWLNFAAGTWVRVPRQECVYVDASYDPSVDSLADHVHTQYFNTGGLWRPSVLVDTSQSLPAYDVASEVYNGGLSINVLSSVIWQDRVELTLYSDTGTVSQPCMVVIRVPKYIEESPGVPLEVSWFSDSDSNSVLRRSVEGGVYSLTQPEEVDGKWFIPVDWSLIGLQVDSIPHLVNGAMIRSARMSAGVGQQLYGVSPSARSLFGTMYGLGLDYQQFPFQFYLSRGVSLGVSRVEYPSYVSIRGYLDPMRSYKTSDGAVGRWPVIDWGYGEELSSTNGNIVPEGGSDDVVGFVASEPTPTDALRDRWGVDSTGSFRLVGGVSKDDRLRALYAKYGGRSIFGYDKKLWVVVNNGTSEEWYYLGSPYTRRGSVSVVGDWNREVTWDASGKIMTPSSFELESDVERLGWTTIEGPDVLSSVLEGEELKGAVEAKDFGAYTNAGSYVIGTPSNGDLSSVQALFTESSHAFDLPEGVTKQYADLSLQDPALGVTPVDRLTVAFTGTKESFAEYLVGAGLLSSVDDIDTYLTWLEDVLGRSVPIGIGVEVIFIPVPSGVDLELGVSSSEGVGASGGSQVYLLSSPYEVRFTEGVSDALRAIVVRSNVGWWVDMMATPVLSVRLAGTDKWKTEVDLDLTSEGVSVEVYAASDFIIK